MKFYLYSDAEIAKVGDARFNALVQREAARWLDIPNYNPTEYRWNATPDQDGTCRLCYEWRRFPPGQRHFGYAWWRMCPSTCGCAHHAGETWMAATDVPVAVQAW
jgi:hypothetical protein